MANNLVLTAAVGYDFKQIELFIRSLRKYYFDKVYIIIDKKDNLIEYQLTKKIYNFKGIRFILIY